MYDTWRTRMASAESVNIWTLRVEFEADLREPCDNLDLFEFQEG